MKKIVFLTHPEVLTWGSTVARSEQMAILIKAAFDQKDFDVSFTINSEISGSIIILNKGYLERVSLDNLADLRSRGNILIADYIDIKPVFEQMKFFDGLMACSHVQSAWLQRETPNVPVFHVTQLVDLRFPNLNLPSDKLRTAYFGTPQNALFREELSHVVDSFFTPTQDTTWMSKLAGYNFHYAVRKRQPWDGFKPFGKGFIAARYECPVIISETDDDVLFYLSNDYPYLTKTEKLEEIIEVLDKASEDFLGPRWNMALDIMRDVKKLSTNDFIIAEFRKMISYFCLTAD